MHSTQSYSEEEYLQSFRAGEEQGFNYFFSYYYKRLSYFAGRYVQNKDVIEDIVADAFIYVWNKREMFTRFGHLRNYLYTIVRCGCYRWLERQQLHSRHHQRASLEKETVEQSVIENITRTEFIHQVYQALELLPPACRTIFKKLYIEGKSVNETAVELQLSPSTVTNQKHRGVGLLKKILFPVNN